MNLTQVLALLGSETPLYAVVDGARDPSRLRNWVIDTRAASWCLFRGEIPAELEDAAPFLLRLKRGERYTDELFKKHLASGSAIVIASAAPSRQMRFHLRRFLRARSESGQIVSFRYYDPRVLSIYLPTCTPEEQTAFFGPIETIVSVNDEGQPQAWKPPNPRPKKELPRSLLWTLRDDQLAEVAMLSFEVRMVLHAKKHFARQAQKLGPEKLREAVHEGLTRAQELGFMTERDCAKYVDLMFAFGRAFEESQPWARELVRNGASMDDLFAAGLAHSRLAFGYVEDPDAEEYA